MNERLRSLGWAAYAVAFLMIVLPLVDAAIGVLPLRIGQVTWRFGAAGILSRALLVPLLGLLVALVTAAVMGHRGMLRTFSIVGFLGAILGILAAIMFGLDALQARVQVRPEVATRFDAAAATALSKYVLGTITALLMGVGGWKAARKRSSRSGLPERSAPAGKGAEDEPVLVSASEG